MINSPFVSLDNPHGYRTRFEYSISNIPGSDTEAGTELILCLASAMKNALKYRLYRSGCEAAEVYVDTPSVAPYNRITVSVLAGTAAPNWFEKEIINGLSESVPYGASVEVTHSKPFN